jgi:PAS domain S-box-containing protein
VSIIQSRPDDATSGTGAPSVTSLRALVVEDNAGDRWFYSELLRHRGYSVRSCESGEEAWDVFREERPPMILLDLMLPGMDGAELCRRIRGLRDGWEPVILAVTGRDEPDALGEMLEAGADDFVRKPVDPQLFAVRMEIAERRARDRAERRGTQTELAVKTWELEQLFRNLRDVFFSVDLTQGRLIQISPAAEDLLGLSAQALARNSDLWRTFLLPREPGGEDPWAGLRTQEPGARVVREYPVTRPGGSTAWIRASVSLERDPASGHLRADGFAVDVTEERVSRSELAERNRELAALYRVSELTLTSSSTERAYAEILEEVARVMRVPIVLLEHLDRSADRLVTLAARGLPASDDPFPEVPLHQTPAGVAVQTGRPVVEADPQSRRDLAHDALTALAPRLWASFPLTAAGAVSGTLTVIDTSPRELDARWSRLGVSLATAIAAYMERMAAEDALRDSDSRHRALAMQLKQANQELESFAYSVSHDLRAPLRTMQGFAHALLQNYGDGLHPEARDYARRIIHSGRQSERLISDLLAYSRLSFEKVEMKAVELETVVTQAMEQVEGYVRESGAEVHVLRPLPVVLGSQTALVQVVSNLLSNAVKFVEEGQVPTVRLTAEERGDYIRLSVEDNGTGVPEGQEERIFRVFERLSTGGEHPGTGIGLAIVRRGMERIGGKCGVDRLPNGGSAFWVEALRERRTSRRPWTRRNRGG